MRRSMRERVERCRGFERLRWYCIEWREKGGGSLGFQNFGGKKKELKKKKKARVYSSGIS